MNASSMIRPRWAAIGAALAVAVGAGGVGLVRATTADQAAAFVAITPCRVVDTRPDFLVGPRNTPLGADDAYSVVAHGQQGQCNLPATAAGVALNVTAVGATAPTFLTVFPTGTDRPNSSSLNPTPGQPPTPNAVTTGLSSDGHFSIYNRFGSVDVIADIVGYYRLAPEASAGEPGPSGPSGQPGERGEPGPRGLSAWDTIPSGTTITGNAGWGGLAPVDPGTPVNQFVGLPAVAPVGLTDDAVQMVAGSPTDADPACTGSSDAPTAPAGKVCLYPYYAAGVADLAGYAAIFESDRSFYVAWFADGSSVPQDVFLTWAYTAP